MKRFKNHLIAAAVLSVLATIGTIMNSHQAAAQPPGPPGGLAVNVVSSIPLQATVSGNVGITGTADVNVKNLATAPVLSLNVNDPGRIPYQKSVTSSGHPVTFPAVPTGKRLVIQHVSIDASLVGVSTSTAVTGDISLSPGPVVGQFGLTILPLGTRTEAIVDQPTLVYADAGQSPTVGLVFFPAGPLSFDFMTAVLTGYLLDCTIAPCAAIAP